MDIIKEFDDLKEDFDEHDTKFKILHDRIDNLKNYLSRLTDEVLIEKSIKAQFKEELKYL